MISEAKKRSNRKWDRENLTILGCKVRRDYADRVRQACADNGDTVNAVIRRALDEYLERSEADHRPEDDQD